MRRVGLLSSLFFFLLLGVAFAVGGYENTEIGKILGGIGTQKSQTADVPAPDPSKLCEYLVDVDGWKSGECDKLKMSGTPAGDMVKVEKEYRDGDKVITIIIFNGIMAQSSWAPFAQEVKVDNDKELGGFTTINGFRAGFNYRKKEHSGSIVIPLTDDVKNRAPNAVMGVNFENMDYEEVVDFMENFDIGSIVDLFQ
ncbi:hypothetical protein [Hippea sp. KM1]|uniref:hypothetical protein n=1 Tax=Hippea sp. KM1 TaxID=944481 RepID=UPI00046D513D|nr:hypothetical protein [Hippea sp. KM1]